MTTNTNNKDKKIVIIEDEDILGKIITSKLQAESYQVTLATDGEQGINKIKEIVPDLILLDMVMPKKNGYEVLRDIKADNNIKNIPIIVISNSGQQSEIERVVDLGVQDYIIKAQFSPEEVLEKVRKYLNQEYTEKGTAPVVNGNSIKNIKVLLAEDDQFLSSLMAQRLGKEGYKIFSATDGKQVLKIVEENIPDLILMDIIMPEMNGLEVVKLIKSQPKFKDVIIIMFSNLGQEHEIEEAKNAGATDFLVKVNFTLKEVVDKINMYLKQKGKI